MLEDWDAPPGRFFVDYRARHGFTTLVGNGVIEEYRTLSGPILLAPAAIVGGVYDAGMLLADERDVEAPLDQGWPPLTIGLDVAAPRLPEGWKSGVLAVMQGKTSSAEFSLWESRLREFSVAEFVVQVLQCTVAAQLAVTIVVTNAPLLPQQLGRLADVDNAAMTVAVATGNRLPRVQEGELHVTNVVAESTLHAITTGLQQLLRE